MEKHFSVQASTATVNFYSYNLLSNNGDEFRADANNNRSIQAMKGIGCTVEGILRNHMPTYTGKRRDSIVLSILKDEWFSRVKEELGKKIY